MGLKDFFYDSSKEETPKEPTKTVGHKQAPVYGDPATNSFLQQGQFTPTVQQPQPFTNNSFLNTVPNQMFNQAPPLVTVPEQRHLDHIAAILLKTNAGRQDFYSFMKMVKKMSVGTSGPALWTNSYAAFSAINDNASSDGLIESAVEYETALTNDANAAKQRHDGKFNDGASDIGRLTNLQTSLQTEIKTLEDTLLSKREHLQQANLDLQAATNKATSSFTSYGLATAAAVQEIQLFKQNINAYLTPQISQ